MFSSHRSQRLAKQLSAAALGLLVCSTASAVEFNLDTTLTATHSDNTLRTRRDQQNNFSLEPGLLLSAMHDGNSLQAALEYQFERRFHTERRNNERNFFRGAANIDWQILPDRLTLNLDQSSTESTRVAIQSGAPNDTDVTDNLSVGPTLFFRVRDTDRLSFTYLYEDRNAILEEDDSNSDVFSGSYVFQATEFSSLTAEHLEEDISFSSELARDLEATTQTLTYAYRNGGSSFILSGGYSEYEREGAESIKGEIGELRWRKEFGTSAITVYGRRQITNQTFRLLNDLTGIDLDDFTLFLDANIAEVFTESAYGIQFSQVVGATEFSVGADLYNYDYEEIRPNRDEYVISFGATRKINRNMTLRARGRYLSSEEDDTPATNLAPATMGTDRNLLLLRAELEWSFARNLFLGAGIEFNKSPGNFDETATYVRARYTLFNRGR